MQNRRPRSERSSAPCNHRQALRWLGVFGLAAITGCSQTGHGVGPGLGIRSTAAGSSSGSGAVSGSVANAGGAGSGGADSGGAGRDSLSAVGAGDGGRGLGPGAGGTGGAESSGASNAGTTAGGSAGGSSTEGGAAGDSGSSTATPGPLVIESDVLKEGVSVAAKYRCDGPSPALSWGGGPATTQSYAIVFIDTTPGFSQGFLHWILYDIPADVNALAEAIPRGPTVSDPAGAKQVKIRDASVSGLRQPPGAPTVVGYRGPCGPGGVFTYDFTLYALSTPTLPNVTAASLPDEVIAAIEAHTLASTLLKLTSME